MFQKTRRPFIFFDFCGSWCGPCKREMDEYSKSRNLDTSSRVCPVWLFFENDSTKWKDVVFQYGLKKEDCFLILNWNLADNFAMQYGWRKEFPHHSIFKKDGSIVKNGVEDFSPMTENTIMGLE